MTTRKQEVDFASELFSNTLDEAVSWISRYLTPDEVFTEDALVESVRQNYSIEDVYTVDDLVAWARKNGYVYQE